MDINKFKDIWDSSIDNAIKNIEEGKHLSKFKIKPVPPKEFFEVWLKQPLFPMQYEVLNQVFTNNYMDWNTSINEIILAFGEGAGKDFTIVRTLTYVCYWLCCLNNPQEYFRVGRDTPIVIANMSVNEDHAKDVFFSQFTTCLRSVINPATGNNFFEELGVDLREGKDIQTRKVELPNHITAYALDSSKYAGEGKNILFAVFDEIAEFRFDKAKQRYENLKNTAFSRFPEHYKIAMLSYPRDEYDFLMTHMKEVQNWPEELKSKVYIKVAAPWEVRSKEGAHPDLIRKRLYRTKADYIQMYRTDPIDAMRRYECKFPETGINRFLKKFDIVLSKCVNFDRPSPFVWESIGKEKEIYLTEKELNEITLQPWFKNAYTYEIYQLEQKLLERPNDEQLKKKLDLEIQKHENAQYFVHIDLSRGIKDCAGLAIIHPYFISPTITGYYVDLVIQIRPEETEIDFEEIRRFIFMLNDKGFDIAKVTLDGFQSVDFSQIIKKRGIDSDIISVDRSRKPYDTFKSLLYQGKVNMYNYLVLVRELKELIVTPKGKVDHPEESQQRLKEEGLKEGSKDCSDAVCGAIYTAVLQETEFGPAVVDETDLETPDVEDIL